MSKFIIKGGKPLNGAIRISGMKNAATPILAACLLTDKECVINNVPRISDVERLMEIIKSMGVRAEWTGDNQVTVCAKDITLHSLDKAAVESMRSSILLLGPLLSRFKEIELPEPGGCIIGKRPIDTHIYALEKLGARIGRDNGYYNLETSGLKGTTVILPEFSVTATENVIMAAVLAEGTTILKIAAAEPHVQDLCNFLNRAGAKIRGIDTHTLIIEGVKELAGAEHTIIPDQIEVGTLAVAAAVTRGNVVIENVIPEHMELVLMKLESAGVRFEIHNTQQSFASQAEGKLAVLEIKPSAMFRAFKLQTFPYPGFPTDLQAPFCILATQCKGTSLIHDPMYEGRMGHINELIKMGADAVVCDPHRVLITGPTPLYGQNIKSLDLRAGATLVIAGLIAEGETVLNDIEILDRGYEKLDERLNALGAEIKRID